MTAVAATAGPAPRIVARRVLPGLTPTLGFTLFYLTGIVLIPLAALVIKPWELGPAGIYAVVTQPRTLAALQLSFSAALAAALVNLPFGLIVAWVLIRYEFPAKRLIDGMVDLPFALPTAVAGIALTAIYAPTGTIGWMFDAIGIQTAYSQLGVLIALLFIGLPFVVRTLEPVLRDLDAETEEAAATLGATRWQTVSRVVAPPLVPALLTGFSLAFGRGVGEYGSVIFIAGNVPGITEIAPLLIVVQLEQYNDAAAAAIGLTMLLISFAIIYGIALLQRPFGSPGRA